MYNFILQNNRQNSLALNSNQYIYSNSLIHQTARFQSRPVIQNNEIQIACMCIRMIFYENVFSASLAVTVYAEYLQFSVEE